MKVPIDILSILLSILGFGGDYSMEQVQFHMMVGIIH